MLIIYTCVHCLYSYSYTQHRFTQLSIHSYKRLQPSSNLTRAQSIPRSELCAVRSSRKSAVGSRSTQLQHFIPPARKGCSDLRSLFSCLRWSVMVSDIKPRLHTLWDGSTKRNHTLVAQRCSFILVMGKKRVLSLSNFKWEQQKHYTLFQKLVLSQRSTR